ncbi:MAG: hypothetical protein JSW10_13260 [Pseudomonadota bacterium]|nr:MAG: hypothetical protein JSW10_13260 [Pseudomonadota bacterium]
MKLRDSNIDRSCRECHESFPDGSYHHPTGVAVPEKMKREMSKPFRASLRREDQKVGCATCHASPIQCLPERAGERAANPMFLRQGPYRLRTGVCFNCHNRDAYQRRNPHDQITKKGKLREETCLICHIETPDLYTAKSIDQVRFNLDNDLSEICMACHPWTPHPGGTLQFFRGGSPNHLVRPSPAVAQRMKDMQQQSQVSLPLDPTNGKIFCGTCHNPHEKGVVKTPAGARGADAPQRLRVRPICTNCHLK